MDMKIHQSIECEQDQHALLRLLTTVCSTPPTDEEIAEWKILYERLTVPSVPTGHRLVRTPPISQVEMDEWKTAYQKICSWDLRELSKKVEFEHDEWYEEPYKDPEWWSDYEKTFA